MAPLPPYILKTPMKSEPWPNTQEIGFTTYPDVSIL